jgi:hypothetical protein
LVKGVDMYVKPMYKYGMLLDKGGYTHHFLYRGTGLSESSSEIPFSNNVGYLRPDWHVAAYQFPSLFFLTIDIRTAYASATSGDTSQTIFRKLKDGKETLHMIDGTVYLEASIYVTSKTAAADLIVSTQSQKKTFVGFFPPITNNSYVELGISEVGSASVTIFKDGVPFLDDVISNVGTDDLNHVLVSGCSLLELHPRGVECRLLQSDVLPRRLEKTYHLCAGYDSAAPQSASRRL